MARKRENPASGPGLKKNTNCACREDNTPIRLEAQGFSSCVPCANCPHFRLVRFNSRKKRHQCSYSGLWLESCGVIECPVRREGGDLRKILPFACQGRLCCRCEHASIRGVFPVSEPIYCRFRHEVVKADSKPFYCPQYRVVREVDA